MVQIFRNCVRFFAILVLAELKPLDEGVKENLVDNGNVRQDRAGITDIFNPLNLLNNQNTNNNEGSNNGPSFPNPFQNLFNGNRSESNDIFKDIKLFFVTAQGALMPASVLTGGIPGFLQGLGNVGNVLGNLGQAAQNLNPFNQNRNK